MSIPFLNLFRRGNIEPDYRRNPMGLQVKTIVAPTQLVSTDVARNWLRQGGNFDDEDIENLIIEVQDKIQRYLGKAVGAQTLSAFWNYVPSYVELPYPPHDTILEVVKIDLHNGGEETVLVLDTDYFISGEYTKTIHFNSWIGTALRVKLTTLSVSVLSTIKTEVGLQYKNRADAGQPEAPIDENTGLSYVSLGQLASFKKLSL